MDFYDPVQPTSAQNLSAETDGENPATNKSFESTKVDQAVEQIETEITEVFNKSTSLLGGFWNNVKQQTQELKKTIPIVSEDSNTNRDEGTTTPSSEGLSFNSFWGAVKNTGLNVLQETKKDFEAVKEEITQIQSNVKETKTGEYLNTLDKDLTELENKAGRFVLKLGSGFKKAFEEAIAIEDPETNKKRGTNSDHDSDLDDGEDVDSSVLFNVPEDISKTSIYGTRGEGALHALHRNATLWLEPSPTTKANYDEFAADFNLDTSTSTIAGDLETYPGLRKLMDSLVGDGKVPYAEFWARYYYLRHQIEEQERARRDLLSAKPDDDDEEEFAWDDDDEHENEAKSEPLADKPILVEVMKNEQLDIKKVEAQNDGYDFVSRQNSKADIVEAAAAATVVPQDVSEAMNNNKITETTAAIVDNVDQEEKSEEKSEEKAEETVEEESEEDDDWE